MIKTKLVHNLGVRSIQFINHFLAIYGIYYCFLINDFNWLLVSLITFWVIGTLGINVNFHRLLAHRSYQTNKFWEIFFSLIGSVCTLGSPLAWVAIHRQHHRYAEKEKDVHSPIILGNWKAWFGFWNYPLISPRIIADMRKDSVQKFIHTNYMLILSIYVAILYILNPLYVLYVYAIPACLTLHAASAIIVIAHRHGYKTYMCSDESKNSWIASLITLGEGWHNNHHANPNRWRQGEKWWEFDIPALIIQLIKK